MKINFWVFVSGLFLLYGIIIFFAGIYYLVTHSTNPANHFHPSIWWGAILFIAGIIFFIIARKEN